MTVPMVEPQLSERSAKACDMARRKRRSIAEIVEQTLDACEVREAGRESAAAFYGRVTKDHGSEIDLEALVREHRTLHAGPEL